MSGFSGYDYDNFGDLVKVVLPDNSAIEYEYQHKTVFAGGVKQVYSTHLLVREIKPDGRVLENEYYDSPKRFARSVKYQRATVGPDLRLVRRA